jgi:hypothetical protein
VRFQVLMGGENEYDSLLGYITVSSPSSSFKGAYCLHYQGDDDGGSTYLWNVGVLQVDYTSVYPRNVTFNY